MPKDPATRTGVSRRSLFAGAAGIALALGGGAVFLHDRRRRDASARAEAEAGTSHAALLRGDLDAALASAIVARALDPSARAPALAFLHATAALAIDGPASPERAVSLLTDARLLGAKGEELAVASLSSLVGIANVPITERQLDALAPKPIGDGAMFHFARGAALDLVGSKESHRAYTLALEAEPTMLLASIRLVRAHLLARRLDRATEAWKALPEHAAKPWLGRALALLGAEVTVSPAPAPAAAALLALPRSVRGIALAIGALEASTDPPPFVREDFDAPLAVTLFGTLALSRGRDALAKDLFTVASRLKGDLDEVAVLGASVALRQGNLARALELAGEGPDKNTALLLKAIEAYETGDAKHLEALAPECRETGAWTLVTTALGILGKGPLPRASDLDAAFARKEPWADMLLFDLALREKRIDEARRVVQHWDGQRTEARQRRARRLENG